MTYQAMGLLASTRHPNWYDAGRFWSGDHLGLAAGYRLGGEIAVHIPRPASPACHERNRPLLNAADPPPIRGRPADPPLTCA